MGAMEHRCYSRKPVRAPVEISHQQRLMGRFTTRDIGLNGMFVETGPTRLRANDLVDISFRTSQGAGRRHTVQAVLIHRSDGGCGFMLEEYGANVFFALKGMMATCSDEVTSTCSDEGRPKQSATIIPLPKRGGNRPVAVSSATRLNTLYTKKGKVVTIMVGERLDISSLDLFNQVCGQARKASAKNIIVDFGGTKYLHDFGMAMLLMLNRHAAKLRDGISLVNCNREIKERLACGGLSARFDLG